MGQPYVNMFPRNCFSLRYLAFSNSPQPACKWVDGWEWLLANRLQTLDDVDFTVLAATSVLGDLMDKCPPAEACRDAFDRMSKATVTMCQSTTGFGSRAVSFSPRSNRNEHPSPGQQFDTSDFSGQHHFGGTSRPPVQFDLNLRDLFPDETQDGRSFGSNLGRWHGPPRSDMASTPSSLPHVKQRDGLIVPVPQHPNSTNRSPAMGPSAPMKSGANDMTYDMYGFSNSNDLDFLTNDNDSTAMFYGDSGLDLGIDEGHNWGDGMQLDLFDGFFFGNVGGVGNSG